MREKANAIYTFIVFKAGVIHAVVPKTLIFTYTE